MSEVKLKRAKPTDVVSAEELHAELDEAAAALPPAATDAMGKAFNIIGDEVVRQEVLARRAGDETMVARLWVALRALNLADSALDESVLYNDFLFNVHDVREELAAMPPWDPNDDDAWVMPKTPDDGA